MTTSAVTDDAVTLNVRVDGAQDGEHLLLSNSLGTDLSMWERQLPAWSDRFSIARYDIRGHGKSDGPAGDYSIERLGRDALAVADALGWQQFDFCGVSLGAMTGFWLAINAPHRLKRLVLANGAPFAGGAPAWSGRLQAAAEGGLAAVAGGTISRWFTPDFAAANPALVEAIHSAFMATSLEGYLGCTAAIRDLDLRHSVGGIAVLILLIGATHDQGPLPEVIEGLAGRIPGAKAVILDAAHLSNIEASEAFNSAVLEFLA
ncbi:alpha/beta fold hydrolase [Novosphingobium sp. BL-52-GroH]|uniref:alpha/beta fold hydrolase n=1 Tax=Novosphingobium sp. BL-52-GroH TaxID=3349877 RepID=UPI00384CA8DE